MKHLIEELRSEVTETWNDMETECAHPWAMRFALIGCGLLSAVLFCAALFA